MPTVADIVAAVDAFMASPKSIAGIDAAPFWGPGWTEHERVIKYPLEVDGEQRGAQLMVVCFPRSRAIKFRLGVLFPAMISRVDFTDETHPNTIGAVEDGLPAIVVGPHYHSWPLNRRFFRGVAVPPKLRNARPFDGPQSFDSVLRWFCADTGIDSLPANHRIALPGMDLLL